MGTELAATLKDDGVFTAEGPCGRYHLMYDGPDERWLVAEACRDGDAQLTSMHHDLDDALRILLASAGLVGRFSVRLPCGNAFQRPGRVPAGEVLGAFGYAVVRSLTGFVVVPAPAGSASGPIRDRLAARLVGRPVEVGTLEFIESAGGSDYWCCDIRMPFEGPILPECASDVFRRAIEGAGLEAVDEVEMDTPKPVRPNAADVLPLSGLGRAA